MKISCLMVGPLEANCYLLADEAGEAAVIVDPGGDADLIVEHCENEGLEPVAIVCTHAHADHIAGVPALKERYPEAALCIGEADAETLADPVRNLTAMLGESARMPSADRRLAEGDAVEFGACRLRVLHTPGHTQGGICLAAEGQQPPVVLCGDLVFAAGVGRTDLPGGDWDALRRSIREKIFALPDDTVLLPGHGPATTVGGEKQSGFPL